MQTVDIRDFRRDTGQYEIILSCDDPVHSTDYVKVRGWYASDALARADARAMMGRDPVLLGMTKIVSSRRIR